MSYLSEKQTKKDRAALVRDLAKAKASWNSAYEKALSGSPDCQVLASAMLSMNNTEFRCVQMGHGDLL